MRRLVLLAVMAMVPLPLLAQNTDIESLSGLQFNLGNPGARSLGMGGAFLALADDASAAEANPAGLTILRKPEFSIEGRNYMQDQVLTTSGTYPDLVRTPFSNYSDRIELSFASIVAPIGDNFTIGGYYHEPLRNKGAGAVLPQRDPLSNRITADVPNAYFSPQRPTPISLQECQQIAQQTGNPNDCLVTTLKPFVTAVDIREQTFGLAGAWKFGNFSLGGTARYQRFNESSFTFRVDENFVFDSASVQATSGAAKFSPRDESDITFAGGLKWQPWEKLSIGAVYKQGAKFDAPVFESTADNGIGNFSPVASSTFHFPDVFGAGVSVRPIPVLTLNLDAVRVKYSNLTDNFISTIGELQPLSSNFQIDDVTELHFGAEYFFSTKIPFALRGGYWKDPAHALAWRGPVNTAETIAAGILFPEGKDQSHWSLGAGLAWPRFQVDAAYDSSEFFKVGSLSFVTRF
jgi:long-chain fatty acid transport protein